MEHTQDAMVAPARNKWILVLFPLSFSLISILYLFFAYYSPYRIDDDSSVFETADFALDGTNYIASALFFAFISRVLYRNPEKSIKTFIGIGVMAFVILSAPAFFWFGPLIFIMLSSVLIVYLAICTVLYVTLKYIISSQKRGSITFPVSVLVISGLVSLIVGYINMSDFLVTERLHQVSNGRGTPTFQTIEECNAFISPQREDNCKKDFVIMRGR